VGVKTQLRRLRKTGVPCDVSFNLNSEVCEAVDYWLIVLLSVFI
jgi:hypothetical protein